MSDQPKGKTPDPAPEAPAADAAPPAPPADPTPPADSTPPAPEAAPEACEICFPSGPPEGALTWGCEHTA